MPNVCLLNSFIICSNIHQSCCGVSKLYTLAKRMCLNFDIHIFSIKSYFLCSNSLDHMMYLSSKSTGFIILVVGRKASLSVRGHGI